ncbi:hypothetical protein UFOVP116_99 [uncultured Caudovirales phage]|uniref:Uncharacterized protein n=1 Tax=uncultured Caudovirales phage TaxID=2100421 RepID=A0A6J5LDF5_9CAUD|nr:hypothetical protein UFOVP116_99 [uncultured Caudovirales phage]
MKQYRINSGNCFSGHEDDCVLDASDPIHQIKAAQFMDGLGSASYLEQLAAANQENKPVAPTINRALIMKENGIKPGTEDWFKLWFDKQ